MPCTATSTTYASTPSQLVSGGAGQVTLTSADAATIANCKITGINRISLQIDATPISLSTVFAGNYAVAVTVGSAYQQLFSAAYQPTAWSGSAMGSGCSASTGVTFQNGGGNFTNASATAPAGSPYAGVYAPTQPGTPFDATLLNQPANSVINLQFTGLGGDISVECAQFVAILAPK